MMLNLRRGTRTRDVIGDGDVTGGHGGSRGSRGITSPGTVKLPTVWRDIDARGQVADGRPHGMGTWRSGSRRTIRGRDVGDRRDKRRLVAFNRLVRPGPARGGGASSRRM